MPRPGNDHELVVMARKAADKARNESKAPSASSPSPASVKKPPEGAKQLDGEPLDPQNVIELQLGLTALVLRGGSTKEAAADLQTQGFAVSPKMLSALKRDHKKEYNEVAERLKGDVEEGIIHRLRDTVIMAESAERKALEIALSELERAEVNHNLRPTDAAITANNIANIKSKSIDRLLTLTGRPSSIIESRDAETLLRKLQISGVMKTVKKDE